MRTSVKVLVASLTLPILSSVAVAQDSLPVDNGIYTYHEAPAYRESESHPLRILGYLLHPVGWVAREAVFRPISYLASSTVESRSILGYRDFAEYRHSKCFGSTDYPDCGSVPPYSQIRGRGMDEAPVADVANAEVTQVHFPDVAFEFDKATLNDLGRGRVRQVAQLLASVPDVQVVVEGHTDVKGSESYNKTLGDKRAAAVVAELGELGIDSARLSPLSYGEEKPIFTEQEPWARAVNRRVSFTVK